MGVMSIRECLGLSLWLLTFAGLSCGNYPLLDVDTNMRIVLVPHDMPVGGIIYRLRASDSDNNFPLTFEVLGALGKGLLSLNFLGCVESESLCQADVILKKALDAGRTYEFQLQVKDTTGDYTKVHAAITATSGTANFNPLFGPRIIQIQEDSKEGTIIEKFEVLKNGLNSRVVHLEIREKSGVIGLKQRLVSNNRTEGTLFLKKPLDFETEPWFTFQLLAMNGWTNTSVDTRNILVSDIIIAVHDVQDTPPRFTLLPPSIELNSSLKIGDLVVKVEAMDGDKQNKRLIRYGFLTESNPFIPFFDLGPMTGEIRLRRNITELLRMAKPNEPIKMTIIAEEIIPETGRFGRSIGSSLDRTMGNITFWFGRGNALGPPVFSSDKYVGEIKENALQGTLVDFGSSGMSLSVSHPNPSEIITLSFTSPGGSGYSAGDRSLIGPRRNNQQSETLLSTFQILPSHGMGNFSFEIRVADTTLLDYELYREIKLMLVGSTSTSDIVQDVELLIHIRDENDNPPIFSQSEYKVDLLEGSPVGTKVVQLRATDKDSTGNYGQIMYTNLLGSDAFHLDQQTGEITVDKPELLDRETEPEIRLYVEAIDGGYTEFSNPTEVRKRASATIVVKLHDKNDNAPTFLQNYYQAVLNPELTAMKVPLYVKAYDTDEGINSQVKYQSLDSRFFVDPTNGEVRLRGSFQRTSDGSGPYLGSFKIKAYDLGNPQQSAETNVQIFSEEMVTREIQFVFPATPEKIWKNQTSIEKMLASLTGGVVGINKVTPIRGNTRSGLTDGTDSGESGESGRSLVPVKSTGNNPPSRAYTSRPGKRGGGGGSGSGELDADSSSSGRKNKAEELSVADKSLVTATVQYPVSASTTRVDLAAFQKAYGGSVSDVNGRGNDGRGGKSQDTEMIKLYEAENRALFWILITFLFILLILFGVFLCCIYCPCCWLYGHCYSKGIKGDRSADKERIIIEKRPVIRHSRNNKTYPSGGDETEDSYDPQLDPERGRPPPRHARREAWSGEEKGSSWRNKPRRYRERPPTPHGKGRQQRFRNQQDVSLEDWDFDPSHAQTDRADEIGPRWQHMQHTSQPQAGTITVPVPISMMHPSQLAQLPQQQQQQVAQQGQQRRVGYVGYAHPGDEDFVRTGRQQPIVDTSGQNMQKTETYTPYNPAAVQSQLPRHYPVGVQPTTAPDAVRAQSVVQQRQTRFFKTETGEVLQFADFEVDDQGKEMLMKRYISEQSANDHEQGAADPNAGGLLIITDEMPTHSKTDDKDVPSPSVHRPGAAIVSKRPPKKRDVSFEQEEEEKLKIQGDQEIPAKSKEPKVKSSEDKKSHHHHHPSKHRKEGSRREEASVEQKEASKKRSRRSQSLSEDSEDHHHHKKHQEQKSKSHSRSRSKSTSKSKDRSRSRSHSPISNVRRKSQSPRPLSANTELKVTESSKTKTKTTSKEAKPLKSSKHPQKTRDSKSKSTDREIPPDKKHHRTPKLKSKEKETPSQNKDKTKTPTAITKKSESKVPVPVIEKNATSSDSDKGGEVDINIIPPSSAPMTDSSSKDKDNENERVNSLPQTPHENEGGGDHSKGTSSKPGEEHDGGGGVGQNITAEDHDHFDEEDSGIGIGAHNAGSVKRNKMLEKKSVFTIAYDEVAQSPLTIRPDTATFNDGEKETP